MCVLSVASTNCHDLCVSVHCWLMDIGYEIRQKLSQEARLATEILAWGTPVLMYKSRSKKVPKREFNNQLQVLIGICISTVCARF